ncbi:MAG: TIGR01897 family CRISPR-associated protein [Spirochaetales bacterium]|nr:TIGR01897 family CRISPR-associated protein [Spirochaetales bacterium]
MSYKYDSLILQIGRLDTNINNKIKFTFDNKEYEAPLSSIALKNILSDKSPNVKAILLYPVSLPLNSIFKGRNENGWYKKINEILTSDDGKASYLKEPQVFFKDHPHSKLVDSFFCIHSLGVYEDIKFETNIQDVVLYILARLIDEYIQNDFRYKNIYIDISSGLNIYIAALLEALRYFQTLEKFFTFSNESLECFIIYTDPIIGSASTTGCNIYKYKSEVKAFFSSPISNEDLSQGLPKKIIEHNLGKDRGLKNNLLKLLENFLILYSAFANAIPLAFYNFDYPSLDNVQNFIKEFIGMMINKIEENFIKSPNFEFKLFIKTILSLFFLRGLINKIQENKISKKCITVNEIFNNTTKIYENLNLNIQSGLIKYELSNTFKNQNIPLNIKDNEDFKKLNDILHQAGNDNLIERNFFAHAGFERTITLLKKENNDICLKYDETKLGEIAKILKSRVKGI